MIDNVNESLAVLRCASTIRERCHSITSAVEAGDSPHFTLKRTRLAEVADTVAQLTRSRFPTLAIPYHSRWRHFEAGGVDRKGELDQALAGRSREATARARIDVTVVSVLLDAGAGSAWTFREGTADYGRSEGLGVASFRAFMGGLFSSDSSDPCRVDAGALEGMDAGVLAKAFQVSDANPLVGLEGRAELLRRLGQALRDHAKIFGADARPGGLFDALASSAEIRADAILRLLLDTTSGIWPSGQRFHDQPIGDVWPHPHAGGTGATAGLVPFHKLSQWMTYSLLEPFEWAGCRVTAHDSLTGLPEYRNGGLLLDAGVLVPRDANFAATPRTPADPWVVEWRALTVALLDALAPLVRERLNVSGAQMPLACVLEGGSWAAGRQMAAQRRPGGGPPLEIVSDGTVF